MHAPLRRGTDSHTIFPALARSSAGRAKFIASAIDYAKKKGFKGIDLDWEYPNWQLKGAECCLVGSACSPILPLHFAC